MADEIFDHEKMDVYRLALEYVAEPFRLAKDLSGLYRHSRDQWLRAAQSIPLNIAEANGKRSLQDRFRFFDIARGSAFECAAIQDLLVISGGMAVATSDPLKGKLKRNVAMLTRLALRADRVSESSAGYQETTFDYEHEHRCAEHEWRQVRSRFGPEPPHARERPDEASLPWSITGGPPVMRSVRCGRIPGWIPYTLKRRSSATPPPGQV